MQDKRLRLLYQLVLDPRQLGMFAALLSNASMLRCDYRQTALQCLDAKVFDECTPSTSRTWIKGYPKRETERRRGLRMYRRGRNDRDPLLPRRLFDTRRACMLTIQSKHLGLD